jgi:hypothetical protein
MAYNFESGGLAVAAAGTPQALSASGVEGDFRWLQFQARQPVFPAVENATSVYIIGPGKTRTTGQRLFPGESYAMPLPVGTRINAAEVFIDAETNSDGVTFVGVRP